MLDVVNPGILKFIIESLMPSYLGMSGPLLVSSNF